MKKYSRVRRNRNKRIKQYLKLIVSSLFLLVRTILELLVYLIKNLAKVCYRAIYKVNTLIGKLFMKLPRITRTLIIYVLLLTFILDFAGIIQDKKIFSFAKVNATTLSLVTPPKASELEEAKVSCKYDEVSCKIYIKGLELGMSKEQVLISIAISKWETGDYTSKAFKSLNNVGGMMCNSGLIEYSSLDEGITAFLTNLKDNYFNIGLDTIEKIQPKYCPIGAKNDPNGLNKYWLSGVTKKIEELK